MTSTKNNKVITTSMPMNEGMSSTKSPKITTRPASDGVQTKGHSPVNTPKTTPKPIADPSNQSE